MIDVQSAIDVIVNTYGNAANSASSLFLSIRAPLFEALQLHVLKSDAVVLRVVLGYALRNLCGGDDADGFDRL